jgi:rSAM/selenodomain-associated transferase 1
MTAPTAPHLALLLKAPRPGTVKTRLAATLGEAEAGRIYRWLVERQVTALPPGWPASVHFDPPAARREMELWLDPLHPGLEYQPQGGGDLGARLTRAFAVEFARGAPAVLAIGGDCPGLDRAILQTAGAALANVDVVLGPAADGGYYLIGLKAPQPALFSGIPWSTPDVLSRTLAALRREQLTTLELPVLEDVDDAAGWLRAGRFGFDAPWSPP